MGEAGGVKEVDGEVQGGAVEGMNLIKLDVAIWVLAFKWRPCSLQHMASESDSHALKIRALNAFFALNEF